VTPLEATDRGVVTGVPLVGDQRLRPEHVEAADLPEVVAAYTSSPDTVPQGRPGKVAVLDLEFARRAEGRTELVRRYQKAPLQVSRPLYYDPERPRMPIVFVLSVGPGMVQGDRYRIDVACGADSEVHLTTQAATKVLGMDHDYATSVANLTVGARGVLEYLPDPIIPCARSRSYHQTTITLPEDATVIVGETIRAGRVAHGERHVYDVLATDLEIRRPGGAPVVVDRVRLRPGDGAGPGVLGDADQVATLHVVSPLAEGPALVEALRAAMDGLDLWWGTSTLPGDHGAWLRLVGGPSPVVDRAMRTAWDTVRRLLLGVPAPDLRKSTTYSN